MGAVLSLLYMLAPSSLKLKKYTQAAYFSPIPSHICRVEERREGAAVAVPMRQQCERWDRSPQIEAALATIMRLNDERVMLVFLPSCSVRSVALCSAIPRDTVAPSKTLLQAVRSH